MGFPYALQEVLMEFIYEIEGLGIVNMTRFRFLIYYKFM